MSDDIGADVLIVGSGIMGSAVARLMRNAEPRLRIVMIDGGPVIGGTPGLHLHDVAEPELWSTYNARVSSGIQGFYAGATPRPTAATSAMDLEPGIHLLGSLREQAEAMPMAAATWNVGGMGAHWTAATPWPAGNEVFDFGDPAAWQQDLATAQRLLGVRPAPFAPTAPGRHVLEVLRRRYAALTPPDRGPQTMPMAVAPQADGRLLRTGPSRIFPALADGDDDAFTLLPSTLALRIDHDGGRARGVIALDVTTGERRRVEAATTVVCADTLRTPQLLFASEIRPEALGRYLNEHAFVTGRVLLDLERAGLRLGDLPRPHDGEFATDSLWLPQNGSAQPFHGQIMNTTYLDEYGSPLAHSVGVSLYSPVESRAENRVRFQDGERDLIGMPRMTIEFTTSRRDDAFIAMGRDELAEIADLFGSFDPEVDSALLPPGSSLHLTGTVRAGTEDDGSSVTSPSGRVWGFENLFLAGNGVIPTPIIANATLTGAITAVRAARAALTQLERART